MAKDRKSNGGELLGPGKSDKWVVWRRARDKRIANPRRVKHLKQPKAPTDSATKGQE